MQQQHSIKSAVVHQPELAQQLPRPSIALIKSKPGTPEVAEGVSWTTESLCNWGFIQTMLAVTDYTYEVRDKLGATKLPIAQVWGPEKLNDQVTELAEKYRGKLIFVRMHQSESYMMDDFGFGGKDMSDAFGLGIVNSFNWEDKDKFGYGGDELDANVHQVRHRESALLI